MATTNPTPATAILRLRRRIHVGWALRQGSHAALWIAIGLVAGVGVARLFGLVLIPTPVWAVALPVLLVPVWCLASRRLPARSVLAAHLDRRAGAHGLVMLAVERDVGEWRDDVTQRLAALELPAVDLARPVARFGLAGAMVAGLAFLPLPPATRSAPRPAAIQAALERAREEIRMSAAAEELRPDDAAALDARARELEERLVRGDPVLWADVDAVEEARRQHEAAQSTDAARLAAGASALAEKLDGEGVPDAGELAEIARLAASLGLLEDLAPELKAVLEKLARHAENTRETGIPHPTLDPQLLEKLGIDPKDLARLAEALQQMGGARLRHRAGGEAPPELGALRELLEREGRLGAAPQGGAELPGARGGEGPFDPTPRDGGDGQGGGRGGLGRGRGDTALEYRGDTELDTSQLRPERLAPGQPIPDRWEELRVLRAEPRAEARPIEAGGGTAAEGAGRATFHRDLAPRHRDAVQRFFSPTKEPRRR
ncbi:MAG: hypothetical protein IT457_15845 [Planctomycetes bacterium]|nr:hypothetical protein [Planctomycetota bacterium]